MTIVEPVRSREPFFNGWETDKARYDFACHSCGAQIAILFKDMLHAAWGWRERTEPDLRTSLADLFSINLASNDISEGQDAVVAAQCLRCSRTTYAYFWFNEYRNSCYLISLRGMASNA